MTSFPSSIPSTNHQIPILQWNINGLPPNWHEIKPALLELNASIICLQESKLKPTDPYNFNLYSYSLYRQDHSYDPSNPGQRRGGVCTYIKNDIPHRLLSHSSKFDLLAIEITITTSSITIINFLPTPSARHPTFSLLSRLPPYHYPNSYPTLW